MQYDWKHGLSPPSTRDTEQFSDPELHSSRNLPMEPMYERGSFLLCFLLSSMMSPRS